MDERARLARPFIPWDGEGVTVEDGSHLYVLFSGMLPSGQVSITDRNGIATHRIFDMLLEAGERHPEAIHIIYGGSYDANMWLGALSKAELRRLRTQQFIHWRNYRLSWRPGKMFYVCRIGPDEEKIGNGVTVYDVVSFFQCPFVKACDSYLGENYAGRDMVIRNKMLRSGFTMKDLAGIKEYNRVELFLLIELADELRSRLHAADLLPRRWDGPGAIAATLLTREGVKGALCKEIPGEVASAARFAYAGGRFEPIKFGHVERKSFEYDVNSAYPAALRTVPNLNRGRWIYHKGDPGQQSFALYHVRSSAARLDIPAPLFWRDKHGFIYYPARVTGWYWSPEIDALREYKRRGHGTFKVLEAWVFEEENENDRPFAFIDELYQKRSVLKAAGEGSHVAIKLGLNSMYGKLAQQVGARKINGVFRTPPFHQLEYAGFTTSHCRAAVLRAAMMNPESIISFETDAVFSSEPLAVPVGSGLGEFDVLSFSSLTYAQSGVYMATMDDGSELVKCRGVDRGTLTRQGVLEAMRQSAGERKVIAKQTRFIGAGIALSQSFERWRTWETADRVITVEPMGKRMHSPDCESCPPGFGLLSGGWHTTMCPVIDPPHSAEFDVAWINDNPEMDMLDKLREQDRDWELEQ